MKSAAIAIFALAVSAAGDGGYFSPANSVQQSTIAFDQALTPTSVSHLISELEARPDATLRLSSQGGDENAALDLAEYIERAGTRVELDKVCASACANSLLVASANLNIRRGTVIGFHHSAVAIEANYQGLGEPVPPAIARGAMRLRALYARRGADIGLLTCSAEMIGLTQEAVDVPVPGRNTTLKGWRTLRRWWVPRSDTLQRFGVRWRDGAPQNDSRAVRSALAADDRAIAYGAASDCAGPS